MTPSPAVALNLAQFVALLSHSRFSLRNVSMEVPACIRALARMVAEWATLTRASTAPLMFFRICADGKKGGVSVCFGWREVHKMRVWVGPRGEGGYNARGEGKSVNRGGRRRRGHKGAEE
jgi:hypothetical protein